MDNMNNDTGCTWSELWSAVRNSYAFAGLAGFFIALGCIVAWEVWVMP